MFGNPETTSGGQALKYYASMRLDIRAKDKITEAGRAEPVGNKVKVKVVKNKVRVQRLSTAMRISLGWVANGVQ
jgi:recombination protein RecA